jgi:hypothetical protein
MGLARHGEGGSASSQQGGAGRWEVSSGLAVRQGSHGECAPSAW